jgi:hypothetical protein
MVKKATGLDLLKRNFNRVEEKFQDFFENRQPRWPSEKHDYLHNHHQALNQFHSSTVSMEKLRITDLPDKIKQEMDLAFEAFKKGDEYD